jgi:hypothetical protein
VEGSELNKGMSQMLIQFTLTLGNMQSLYELTT